MKRREKLSAPLCKKQNGSTLVGVLAATVFIGIVTTFMVKNTGSQSEASRGYGTLSTMYSTLGSGLISTQTNLQRAQGANAAIPIINNFLANNPQANTFLIGQAAQKQNLGTGQFFNSNLVNVRNINNNAIRGTIAVNAGRNAGARNLQQARVFGTFGGLQIINNAVWTDNNALFLGGNFNAGFSNINVNGGGDVTIMGDSRITNPMAVEGSFYVGGDFLFHAGLTVGGPLLIEGVATIGVGVPFTFNTPPGARVNVGFGSIVSNVWGDPIDISGNLFINNGIQSGNSGGNLEGLNFNGVGGGNQFHFNVPNGITADPIVGNNTINTQNFTLTEQTDPMNLFQRVGMNQTRLNPPQVLDIANQVVPLPGHPPIAGATHRVYNHADIGMGGWNLNALYNEAEANGELFDGHLVVHINNQNVDTWISGWSPEFNEKVIFVVDSPINGDLPLGPDASALVYVRGNGILGKQPDGNGGFGPRWGETFNGLIFIDETATAPQHQIHSGVNGAVINTSQGSLGTLGAPTFTIDYNRNLLGQYATLIPGNGGGGVQVIFANNNQSIEFNAFGYYYH